MQTFLLSFAACLFVTTAGREQLRVARLAGVLGMRAGLIAAVGTSAIVTSSIAAWVGAMIGPMLSTSAKSMVVAIALLLAALQLAVLRAKPAPKEPTWSFGAILIVLIAAQVGDATRLVLLVLTIETSEPILVGLGGALGSGAALLLGCFLGAEWERRLPCLLLSRAVSAILLLTALLIGYSGKFLGY